MKLKKIFTALLGILVLAGCGKNIFDGDTYDSTTGGKTTGVEYTAEDIRYYTEKDEVIFRQGAKEFYKSYDGFCAVALANIGNAFGPVLVGEDSIQTQYSTNKDTSVFTSGGSVVVGGKTYFYSSGKSFISGKLDPNFKYDNYVSNEKTLEGVAKELATLATFVPVEESKKAVFNFELLDSGKYAVYAGPYASVNTKLTIPSKYNNIDVVEIKKSGFRDLTNINEVVFENGSSINSIKSYAFNGCSNLRYVVIPSTVTTIGESTFYKCDDALLFFGVEARPSGYDSNFNSDQRRAYWGYKGYACSNDFVYGIKNDNAISVVKYIGSDVSLEIPSSYESLSVSHVEKYAFYNQGLIKNISLPSGLKTIGDFAFCDCVRLEKIIMPNGTVSIGRYVFNGCSNLRYVVIPSTVTTIGESTFYKCDDALLFFGVEARPSGYDSNFNSDQRRAYWGYKGYACSNDFVYGIKNDNAISVVKYIGSDVSLEIPSSYESLSVSHVEKYAFYNQGLIKNISLPSGLKTIGDFAFCDCVRLEKIIMPNGTVSIGRYVFNGCSNLRYVVIPSTVTTIGESTFYKCDDALLFLGMNGPLSGFDSNFNSDSKRAYYGYIDYIVSDDFVFGLNNNDELAVIKFIGGNKTDVVIPNQFNSKNVTRVEKYAFYNQNLVENVSFPSCLKTIGDYAFYGCTRLEKLVFPAGTASLSRYVFNGCSGLQYVIIPSSLTTIGDFTFYNCGTAKFYSELASKPVGYSSNWQSGYNTVYWAGQWYLDGSGVPHAY